MGTMGDGPDEGQDDCHCLRASGKPFTGMCAVSLDSDALFIFGSISTVRFLFERPRIFFITSRGELKDSYIGNLQCYLIPPRLRR